jgi:hypothetical protein
LENPGDTARVQAHKVVFENRRWWAGKVDRGQWGDDPAVNVANVQGVVVTPEQLADLRDVQARKALRFDWSDACGGSRTAIAIEMLTPAASVTLTFLSNLRFEFRKHSQLFVGFFRLRFFPSVRFSVIA